MNLQQRIFLLTRLGEYMVSDESLWLQAKEKASQENGWFIAEFIDKAAINIAQVFLQKNILEAWADDHKLQTVNDKPKTVGVVMAGNIPMVGFHDLLCVFISGHKAVIKLASKDQVLIKHLITKMTQWDDRVANLIQWADMLKGCDAYIATGNNNSSRYFEYYFGKYPHIIRKNKTSVAILEGNESNEDLKKLADDVYTYFGLGCRNVTKIYVPPHYDFVPLLNAFKKYDYLMDNHHYKNNYDYNLTLHILNKKYYMTNGSVLLVENYSMFSPISQLNYEFYDDKKKLLDGLGNSEDLQAIIAKDLTPFGEGQRPTVNDYADNANTLDFLIKL